MVQQTQMQLSYARLWRKPQRVRNKDGGLRRQGLHGPAFHFLKMDITENRGNMAESGKDHQIELNVQGMT